MSRNTRYPTRSTVNRAQNNSGVGGSSNSNNVPERRSERTRSQADRLGAASSQSSRDYTRVHLPTQHHGHPTQPQQQTAHYPAMYRNPANQGTHHAMLSNGGPVSVPNLTITPVSLNGHLQYRPNTSTTTSYQQQGYTHSMPRQSDIYHPTARQEVRFIKLNSFDDQKVLIKPRTINMSNLPGNNFQVNDVAAYLTNENYRVFLRFCKLSSALVEQNDCLPKSFNLMINQAAFQVKNKYTFAPYDITQRIACEKSNDIHIRISIDPNSNEVNEEFVYGLFLVKKVDHRVLLENFKKRLPYDAKYAIELAKKKLNPLDDGDEIAIVEASNQIKVQLLCPLSATRIKVPARSKYCDHVHCFDAESFININEITPRWKCPICKIYIKLDDMVIDGFFLQILRNAPNNCVEAEILPDGHFEYIYDLSKSTGGTTSATHIDASSSACSKRTFEEDSKDTMTSGPIKIPRTETEIECITIDDSDDESSDSDTNTLPNSDSPSDNQDKSDDEIAIVFEKIVPPKNTSNSTTNTSSSNSNPNSNSNSNSYAEQPTAALQNNHHSSNSNSNDSQMMANYPGFSTAYGNTTVTSTAYMNGRSGISPAVNSNYYSPNTATTVPNTTYALPSNTVSNMGRPGSSLLTSNSNAYTSYNINNYLPTMSTNTMPSTQGVDLTPNQLNMNPKNDNIVESFSNNGGVWKDSNYSIYHYFKPANNYTQQMNNVNGLDNGLGGSDDLDLNFMEASMRSDSMSANFPTFRRD